MSTKLIQDEPVQLYRWKDVFTPTGTDFLIPRDQDSRRSSVADLVVVNNKLLLLGCNLIIEKACN